MEDREKETENIRKIKEKLSKSNVNIQIVRILQKEKWAEIVIQIKKIF